jgi:copper chaperone CopZ
MAKIEGMLKKTKGVSHAEVLFNSSRLKVEFDEAVTDVATLTNNIGNLGYEVLGER